MYVYVSVHEGHAWQHSLILRRRGLDVLFTLASNFRYTCTGANLCTSRVHTNTQYLIYFQDKFPFFSALTCFFPPFSSYQSPSIKFSCAACDHRVFVCVCVCSQRQDNSVREYNMLFFPCCDMIDTLCDRRVITGHLLTSVCFFWGGQQELVKHTHDTADKSNLRMALDAMKVGARIYACSCPSMDSFLKKGT